MRQRFITTTELAIIEAAYGWRNASKIGDETGRMVWIDSLADAVDSDKAFMMSGLRRRARTPEPPQGEAGA